jgi:hypothetical protein
MKKSTYMIFASVLLILIATMIIGFMWLGKNKDIHSVEYSNKTETKSLPRFSHLIIKENFSVCLEHYMKLNTSFGKGNIIHPFDSGDMDIYSEGRNEISLPKEFMDYSKFTMHGDTMVIELGCPRDFAKNVYHEITKSDYDMNRNYDARFTYQGHYYALMTGRTQYKSPKMKMQISGELKTIAYPHIFHVTLHQFHQDSLSVNSNYLVSLSGCTFNQVNTVSGNNTPSVYLYKTNIKKLYLNIEDGFDCACDASQVDEYFLTGNKEKVSKSQPELNLNYNSPCSIHWMPTK